MYTVYNAHKHIHKHRNTYTYIYIFVRYSSPKKKLPALRRQCRLNRHRPESWCWLRSRTDGQDRDFAEEPDSTVPQSRSPPAKPDKTPETPLTSKHTETQTHTYTTYTDLKGTHSARI